MKVVIPLRTALDDPKLLGDILVGPSWDGWKALLLAAAGEVLNDEERAHFTRLTGRAREPGNGALCEIFLMVGGRRGGKSRALTTFCAWLAIQDWSDDLALGEKGRVMIIAPSISQSENTMSYLREIFKENALLQSLIERETKDEIHLKRKIVFEVQAASAATSRGKTAICVLADESAFLKSGDAVNNDADIFTALRPCLGSTNGPLLLTSSPDGEDGLTYDLYRRFFGPDGDPAVIVAKGSTKDLNPKFRDSVIDRAYQQDPTAAATEYGGEFRAPTTAYITRDLVERCIEKGVTGPRRRLPGIAYTAYVDVSSGAGADSFTACVSHKIIDNDRHVTVIDWLYEAKPPFDPLVVIADLCTKLQTWNVTDVTGDQYGKPYVTAFARCGVRYKLASLTTSEVFLHALPAWTSGSVLLYEGLDDTAIRQLVGLRRTYTNGREKIEHAKKNGHDDLAVAICGAIYLTTPVEFNTVAIESLEGIGVFSQPRLYYGDANADTATDAFMRQQSGLYGRSRMDGGSIKTSFGGLGFVR
jgi:hypothetical protein